MQTKPFSPLISQAECEKAVSQWSDTFTGEHEEADGGACYIKSAPAGAFSNVSAIANKGRYGEYKTASEKEVSASPVLLK